MSKVCKISLHFLDILGCLSKSGSSCLYWASVVQVDRTKHRPRISIEICVDTSFFARADLIFQKSVKKRAEAAEMMEKELADTEARQEKVDHKLKERIGKSKENQKKGETVAHTERIWDFYAFVDPVFSYLSSQHRQKKELWSGTITAFFAVTYQIKQAKYFVKININLKNINFKLKPDFISLSFSIGKSNFYLVAFMTCSC